MLKNFPGSSKTALGTQSLCLRRTSLSHTFWIWDNRDISLKESLEIWCHGDIKGMFINGASVQYNSFPSSAGLPIISFKYGILLILVRAAMSAYKLGYFWIILMVLIWLWIHPIFPPTPTWAAMMLTHNSRGSSNFSGCVYSSFAMVKLFSFHTCVKKGIFKSTIFL